jgi:hypothetical protein
VKEDNAPDAIFQPQVLQSPSSVQQKTEEKRGQNYIQENKQKRKDSIHFEILADSNPIFQNRIKPFLALLRFFSFLFPLIKHRWLVLMISDPAYNAPPYSLDC